MPLDQLTLDANIVHRILKRDRATGVIAQLLEMADRGDVDLRITATIHEDIPHDPLASRLKELEPLGISETGTVARVGNWVLGRDMVGSREFVLFMTVGEKLAAERVPNPPDSRDWDHLHAHMLMQRDAFLTWDQGILCLAPELLEWKIAVMTPEQYFISRSG